MTTYMDQHMIRQEPFYQPQGNEIELYEAAYAARLPVMLKGPTGCGKSRFIEHMAWRLGKPLITVACNEDMTASDLVGRYLLDASGTRWLDGPLTVAARHGAICYLDEIVEARQDTTVVIHPLTDHRRALPLDKKGELIHAHPDFQLVISYNPGYQNLMKDLKQSTKQRFAAMGGPRPVEASETRVRASRSRLSCLRHTNDLPTVRSWRNRRTAHRGGADTKDDSSRLRFSSAWSAVQLASQRRFVTRATGTSGHSPSGCLALSPHSPSSTRLPVSAEAT